MQLLNHSLNQTMLPSAKKLEWHLKIYIKGAWRIGLIVSEPVNDNRIKGLFMKLKNENLLLVFGMLSLTIAILLGRYLGPSKFIDFMEGVFYGVSIILNLGYLVKTKNRNSNRS